MSKVLQALRQEHAHMGRLLDALERQIAEFDQGGQPDYDIVQGIIDYCLTFPDLYHHPKEDLVFERLRGRDPASAETLDNLLAEHEALGAATRRFAATIHNVLREAEVPREAVHQVARSFLDFYRQHIEKEEKWFFPVALEILTAEDWKDIEAQLTESEDPLFGGEPEERFTALRKHILAWEREDEMRA